MIQLRATTFPTGRRQMMTLLESLRILQLLASFQFPSLKVKGGKTKNAYGNYRRKDYKKPVEDKTNKSFSVM